MRYLREQYALSRTDVAEAIGRSTNFVLKAESLTYPDYPAALADFYCQEAPPPQLDIPNWEPQDRQLLQDAYRELQRTARQAFLSHWVPRTALSIHRGAGSLTRSDLAKGSSQPFRRRWISRPHYLEIAARVSEVREIDTLANLDMCPTQYALSQGLCIPASHVFKYDNVPTISDVMYTAVTDLADFIFSGKFYAEYGYDDDMQRVGTAVIAMFEHFKEQHGGPNLARRAR